MFPLSSQTCSQRSHLRLRLPPCQVRVSTSFPRRLIDEAHSALLLVFASSGFRFCGLWVSVSSSPFFLFAFAFADKLSPFLFSASTSVSTLSYASENRDDIIDRLALDSGTILRSVGDWRGSSSRSKTSTRLLLRSEADFPFVIRALRQLHLLRDSLHSSFC